MIKFIYFLGVFNLIFLSIRMIFGQIVVTFELNGEHSTIAKFFNLLEVIGVVWITYIITSNYELIFTLL